VNTWRGRGPAPTDLLARYTEHRQQGHSHRGALLAIARRFSLGSASVAYRLITREQWAEARRQPPGHDTQGR
jgi:hypothetical protein